KIELSPYRLPFDADSFDIVLSTSVLEHANNPGEYLPEIHRVLKPGGTAMHLLPGKWYLPRSRTSWCRSPTISIRAAHRGGSPCGQCSACAIPSTRARAGAMSSPSAARSTTITCSTWGSAEHARLSRAVFGNCEWPMEFYIAHAHGAFAGLCRKLPL